ncbi:uncharacterized protein LOC129950673 [Eupeodes corollae]|uniref:uncharacterized protein LOC129950673 n=1 Tax=Eupeodes corollae TaxID=290404 RepID=UPI002492B4B2|nr:uncharacterized protein LOC129950673 [Eupeodes corollae]
MELLEQNLENAKRYHEEIVSGGKLEENFKKEDMIAVFDQIRAIYLEYRTEMMDGLDKLSPSAPLTPTVGAPPSTGLPSAIHQSQPNVLKLPPIKPPTFSGSYTSWRSYHDIFTSLVHNNPGLNEIQKMHFLKESLTGDAERLLHHLDLSSGNYAKAWDLLKERYDHKRVLVNSYLKVFFGQPVQSKESAETLKSLLDTTIEVVHALENLGLPVKDWDTILIYILFQKLSAKTQQLWEEKLGNNKELPTFADFTDFLKSRFRTLEAIVQQASCTTQPKPVTKSPVTAKTFHAKTQKQQFKTQYQCQICKKGQHSLMKCYRFLNMDAVQKQQAVQQAGVCENCLAYSHKTRFCLSNRSCYFCNQKHHSFLHNNLHTQNTISNPSNSISQNSSSNANNSTHFQQRSSQLQNQQVAVNPNAPAFQPTGESVPGCNTRHNFYASQVHGTQILLATAIVRVKCEYGRFSDLRALIDPGSDATFISESAARLLNLTQHQTNVNVSGLGKVSSGISHSYVNIMFKSKHSTFEGATKAYIFKSLTGLLPTHKMIPHNYDHLANLQLADPEFYVPAPIDILFGSDVYPDIILPEIIRSEHVVAPIAQNTQLGWIILGKNPEVTPKSIRSFFQHIDLDTQIRKFWEIEEIPFVIRASEEDIACEKYFNETTKRLCDGRYEVNLPFKVGFHPELGSSKEMATRRFLSLERRFERDPKLQESYSQCIMEYLSLKHMEEVDVNDPILKTPFHYFLPHHAVFKESSSTTKLRVVFDAASKTYDGTSLNQHLMTGPKLQKNIVDIILKWRAFKFTITADIEKMYRQIFVQELDRYYQLIIWRENPKQPIKVFKLKTVTFGTACAPYLAIRVLHKAADDESERYPKGALAVKSEMYVDDFISGGDSIDETRIKREETRNLLASAGLKLRKWTSNCKDLLQDLPKEDCEITFEVPFQSKDHVKTLGIRWNPQEDSFSFKNFQQETDEVTKRTMLSAIAKLFDPLGWIAPCVIKAKIIMQKLWCRGTDWDEPISSDLKEEWQVFQKELPLIQHVKIPRWINTHNTQKSVEFHGFSDASEKAYGAVVFIRVLDNAENIHMHILISKTKVAPLKTVSLPRLELCGAVLLASLLNYTKEVLHVSNAKVYAWSDSMITLAWIKAQPSKWTTFVSNRVAEIQRLTNCDIWKHIPTDHNPADLASRGVSPSALGTQDLWWIGPSFLREKWQFEIPVQPSTLETEIERRTEKKQCLIANSDEADDDINRCILRCSRLSKIIRAIAFCYRFKWNCLAKRRKTLRISGELNPDELQVAAFLVHKAVQRLMFTAELSELENKNTIPKSLLSLNAFIDGNGLLRVGGRLENTLLSYNQQHPIILKPNYHFSELVMRDAHNKTLHGGNQQTAAFIRMTYWITRLKQHVKKHIHNCPICFRYKKRSLQQLMGSLPAPRVRISRPFTHTGVDYAGPIEIKTWKGRGAKTFKGYFAIFICLSTKAIHLETVSDLTTQAFLAALRRFTSRRGICAQIYSDCGTNFVGANRELARMLEEAKHDWKEIAGTLANSGTNWNFIPPASPHFGGLWEAGVKSVKHHLKRTTRDERLTFEELYTLLTQIEACLNSRPLCPLSDNIDDLDYLTPGHFLIGEPLLTIPQKDKNVENMSYLDRWKKTQALVNVFWQKWNGEYLSRLQQRPKWTKREAEPKVGSLVLVKDERLPPSQWALARITDTHPGADGLVRVVTLKTKSGIMKRPITKICYLPCNTSTDENTLI